MVNLFDEASGKISESVKRNIGSIAQLQQEFLNQRSATACLGDRIADLVASPLFITAHVLWFVGWILVNSLAGLRMVRFDPYPFPFLALCLATEVILLTTFVLMSQKQQARQADQWAHVALQVSLLSEQETTKMLQLLQAICHQLGLKSLAHDQQLKEMIQTTPIVAIVEELGKVREADDATPLAAKIFVGDELEAA